MNFKVYLIFGCLFILLFYNIYSNNRKFTHIAQLEEKLSNNKELLQRKDDIIRQLELNLTSSNINFNALKLQIMNANVEYHKEFKVKHFVLFDTKDTHSSQIKPRVSSIQNAYNGEHILIHVYGIGLEEKHKNEMVLWENVVYWDIEHYFFYARNLERKISIQDSLWKPLILKHAADTFGEFVYIGNGFLEKKLTFSSSFITDFQSHGSFFGCNDYATSNLTLYKRFSSFDFDIIVLKQKSSFYHHFLLPLTECSRLKCTVDRMKSSYFKTFLLDDQNIYQCHLYDKKITGMTQMVGKYEHCNIKFREDLIFTPTQLPLYPYKSWEPFNKNPPEDYTKYIKKDGRIHIAFGVPTTSNKLENIKDNAILTVFLPSLKNTIPKKNTRDGNKYLFIMYLSVDRSDPYFESKETRQRFIDLVLETMEDFNFNVEIISAIDSSAWVTMLWNAAFQHAIDDGADYFYQLNDDARFETEKWAEIFINVLVSNPVKENFGVVAPYETLINQFTNDMMTQAFVHKTHLEIFGFLFPFSFKNYYCDNWISHIYCDLKSCTISKVLLRNTQKYGTRYEICDDYGGRRYRIEMAKWKPRLREYLDQVEISYD